MRRLIAGALTALTLFALAPDEAEARGRRRTRSWSCASCKVRVKGHYRTSSTGKSYYVRSYTRTRGKGN